MDIADLIAVETSTSTGPPNTITFKALSGRQIVVVPCDGIVQVQFDSVTNQVSERIYFDRGYALNNAYFIEIGKEGSAEGVNKVDPTCYLFGNTRYSSCQTGSCSQPVAASGCCG